MGSPGDGKPGGALGRGGPRSQPTWRAAREAGGTPGARAPARVGPASPALGPLSRRAWGARSARRREIQTADARGPGRARRLGARGAAGGEGAAAFTHRCLSLTPFNPVSPGCSLPLGTMVTKAGLRDLCGAQGLPGKTSMGPQLGSPEISKVCPWNWSAAAVTSLVHQKLSPPTTCAVGQAEGMKQTREVQSGSRNRAVEGWG